MIARTVRWVLRCLGILVVLAGAVYGVGLLLPREHSVALEGRVARPAAELAATIRAVADYPRWRPAVQVRDIETTGGSVSYVEVSAGERVAYRLTERVPDARFVAAIADQSLPFGGSWTISLTPIPNGGITLVRIQEDGIVRDPLYRFFAQLVFGYTSSIHSYLEALGATDIGPAPAS